MPSPTTQIPGEAVRPTRVRYVLLGLVLLLATVAYADRAILSISAPGIKQQFGLSPVQLGYVLSAFSWGRIPAERTRDPRRELADMSSNCSTTRPPVAGPSSVSTAP